MCLNKIIVARRAVDLWTYDHILRAKSSNCNQVYSCLHENSSANLARDSKPFRIILHQDAVGCLFLFIFPNMLILENMFYTLYINNNAFSCAFCSIICCEQEKFRKVLANLVILLYNTIGKVSKNDRFVKVTQFLHYKSIKNREQ